MKTRTLATLAIVLLAIVAGVALLYAVRVQTPTTTVSAPTPTATATATATPTASPVTPTASPTAPPPTAAPTGTITGGLGYPSEFIPPLTVYAISVADQRVVFSVDTPRYPLATNTPPRPGYIITGVAPGTYYVLAYRNDDVNVEAKNRPGLYSRYVVQCIQPGERTQPTPGTTCPPDHSLLPVTVRPGETTSQIDVKDWYYQQATYPPRPR